MNLNQIAKELEKHAAQWESILKHSKRKNAKPAVHPGKRILELLDRAYHSQKFPRELDARCNELYQEVTEAIPIWLDWECVEDFKLPIIEHVHNFADLLSSSAKENRKGMPLAEANLKLRPILKKDPYIKAKAAATKVGCSESTIVNTDAWKSVKENLKSGCKPKAQRLTDTRLKVTPVEDAELRKLIDEQSRDALEDAENKQGKKQRRRYPSV